MKEVGDIIRKNKALAAGVILLLLLISLPLYKQGIMCNDELLARLWGMQGPFTFYKHYFRVYLDIGRPLSAPVNSLNMYLGFIGGGSGSFRLLQIMTIWLDAGLFGIFLYKLFHSGSFALICSLSVVAFLPISFEHTAPNAFNALLNIPFAILLLSLILFENYLNNDKKIMLILSMVLLFVNLTCYEAFLMFIPLYWCMIIRKDGFRNIRQFVRKCMYPAVIATIFLVLYVAFRYLVPTEYEGIQISGFSLKSAAAVVWQLFKTSFPGYYLFKAEYRQWALDYNQLQIENYVRILSVCALFGLLIFYLLKKGDDVRGDGKAFWGYLGAGFLCIILPSFPNAAAKMYQESVGGWWKAVPITYFCYFGAIFVCWFCIWRLIRRYSAKWMMVFVAVGAAVYLFPIQIMNDIFAQQQNKVFHRVTAIEELFSTELAEAFDGKDFYSTDLFKNINILAIHDSYWDDFAGMKGVNVKVINASGTSDDRRIYYDDDQFTVWAGNSVCILTPDLKEGYGVCQYNGEKFVLVKYENPLEDNGLYEYYYTLADGELMLADREVFRAELSENLVGSSLESCRKVKGFYEDGWVEQDSQFLVMTGAEGKVEIQIYYPPDGLGEHTISVYVDGILGEEAEIQGEGQTILVEAEPNRLIRLGLETDFVQENTGQDERKLAVIISSIQAY